MLIKLPQAYVVTLVTVLFLWLVPTSAHAAALYLSPSSGTYTVGQTFSVSVFVSSTDQSMNAVSGVVTFPPDKLSVASVSKAATIINFWAQEPYFTSNTVNFEGVVFNPGYTGGGGKIVQINFLARATGTANVSFSSGSVLANDGNGTNITSSLLNASFNLQDIAYLPNAPQILSTTHPDQNKWYTDKNPTFSWSPPVDVDMVRVLFDQAEFNVPTSVYQPPISEQKYEEIADGIWYFHLQYHNEDGWGPTANYRVQVDTTPPEKFDIKEVTREDPTEPMVKFLFEVTETPSGVEYYEVRIDNGDWARWDSNGSNEYTTQSLDAGEHRIFVKVFDKAGNSLEQSARFLIASIDPPVFIDYDPVLQVNKYFVLKGKTYANSLVTVWLQRDGEVEKEYKVESDADGKFTFVSEDRLPEGGYKLWAKVTDTRGATSPATEKITIKVKQPPLIYIPFERTSLIYLIGGLLILVIIIASIIGWHYWNEHINERGVSKSKRKKSD